MEAKGDNMEEIRKLALITKMILIISSIMLLINLILGFTFIKKINSVDSNVIGISTQLINLELIDEN